MHAQCTLNQTRSLPPRARPNSQKHPPPELPPSAALVGAPLWSLFPSLPAVVAHAREAAGNGESFRITGAALVGLPGCMFELVLT